MGGTRCEEGVEGAVWGEPERWWRCSYNKRRGGATFSPIPLNFFERNGRKDGEH